MSLSNAPKISIITVCYQAVGTIEQTIVNVIDQTYSNVEYIIIDGASNDGTVDIIKRYQDQIAYWISEPDTGIYEAMNKGINKASGDYVYFLGADDCLFNANCMETISCYLQTSQPDVLCGRIYVVDDVLGTKMQRLTGRPLTCEEVFCGLIAPHQGMFVRSDLMKQYKYNEHYRIAGDYDLFLRLIKDGRSIQYVDEIVAFYSNGGIGCSRTMPRVYECIDSIRNNLSEDYVAKYQQKEGIGERSRVQLDRFIRKILGWLGLIRYYRLYYGWEPHQCDNKLCRWCGK